MSAPRSHFRLCLPALFIALAMQPALHASDAKEDSSKDPRHAQPTRHFYDAALDPVKRSAGAVADGAVVVGQKIKAGALQVRDLLGVMLPGEAERDRWVFDFEPKVADMARREFVRYPFLVHYNVTKRLEFYGGATPVSPNPINSGYDARWSMGQGTLGVRYDIKDRILIFDRTVIGFEVNQPLGRPPKDLIDQYTHLRPFATFTCPFKPLPDTTFFVSTYYDKSLWSHEWYDEPPDHVRTDTFEVAPGFIYKPGQYGMVIQYGIQFLNRTAGDEVDHYGKLGFLWDVPEARSRKWGLGGKWQAELGVKIRDDQSRDPKFGVYGRVKWKTDIFRKKWKELTK